MPANGRWYLTRRLKGQTWFYLKKPLGFKRLSTGKVFNFKFVRHWRFELVGMENINFMEL